MDPIPTPTGAPSPGADNNPVVQADSSIGRLLNSQRPTVIRLASNAPLERPRARLTPTYGEEGLGGVGARGPLIPAAPNRESVPILVSLLTQPSMHQVRQAAPPGLAEAALGISDARQSAQLREDEGVAIPADSVESIPEPINTSATGIVQEAAQLFMGDALTPNTPPDVTPSSLIEQNLLTAILQGESTSPPTVGHPLLGQAQIECFDRAFSEHRRKKGSSHGLPPANAAGPSRPSQPGSRPTVSTQSDIRARRDKSAHTLLKQLSTLHRYFDLDTRLEHFTQWHPNIDKLVRSVTKQLEDGVQNGHTESIELGITVLNSFTRWGCVERDRDFSKHFKDRSVAEILQSHDSFISLFRTMVNLQGDRRVPRKLQESVQQCLGWFARHVAKNDLSKLRQFDGRLQVLPPSEVMCLTDYDVAFQALARKLDNSVSQAGQARSTLIINRHGNDLAVRTSQEQRAKKALSRLRTLELEEGAQAGSIQDAQFGRQKSIRKQQQQQVTRYNESYASTQAKASKKKALTLQFESSKTIAGREVAARADRSRRNRALQDDATRAMLAAPPVAGSMVGQAAIAAAQSRATTPPGLGSMQQNAITLEPAALGSANERLLPRAEASWTLPPATILTAHRSIASSAGARAASNAKHQPPVKTVPVPWSNEPPPWASSTSSTAPLPPLWQGSQESLHLQVVYGEEQSDMVFKPESTVRILFNDGVEAPVLSDQSVIPYSAQRAESAPSHTLPRPVMVGSTRSEGHVHVGFNVGGSEVMLTSNEPIEIRRQTGNGRISDMVMPGPSESPRKALDRE